MMPHELASTQADLLLRYYTDSSKSSPIARNKVFPFKSELSDLEKKNA